ncbi:hypothetical protein ACRALDRAFT_206736 [Sodiomyces alcalophilus JCM 7366]|uniref:uncharacterized protein n=1 Tax=Sodiomyces alcalophilus JCM 7366 TaxID=591952 RepID=UPI0039B4C342
MYQFVVWGSREYEIIMNTKKRGAHIQPTTDVRSKIRIIHHAPPSSHDEKKHTCGYPRSKQAQQTGAGRNVNVQKMRNGTKKKNAKCRHQLRIEVDIKKKESSGRQESNCKAKAEMRKMPPGVPPWVATPSWTPRAAYGGIVVGETGADDIPPASENESNRKEIPLCSNTNSDR